jgi:hypothetical protein
MFTFKTLTMICNHMEHNFKLQEMLRETLYDIGITTIPKSQTIRF